MTMNRREFMAASVAGVAMLNPGIKAFAPPAGKTQVATPRMTGLSSTRDIDARRQWPCCLLLRCWKPA